MPQTESGNSCCNGERPATAPLSYTVSFKNNLLRSAGRLRPAAAADKGYLTTGGQTLNFVRDAC